MKILHWKHTDWSARKFIFTLGQEVIGQLTFNSSWNFNAVYTDKETELKFSQKSFFEKDILITKDEKVIGKIKTNWISGVQSLKLETGELFILSSNFWGNNVNWKDDRGESIVNYEQATMSSMGKGVIHLNDSITIEIEKLLVSSGLFARQLMYKRVVLVVIIMIPILAASRR